MFFPLIATGASATVHIGHRTLVFHDEERNNRAVTAEIYYPSDQEGDNTPVSTGRFPLLLFAHGYQQVFTVYHYLWETLVPKGYIMAFPTTERGLTINTDEYASDISFLLNSLLSTVSGKTSYNTVFLEGHLNGTSALMGHSTGGGACYIAQHSSPAADTIVTLAAIGSLYTPIYGSSPIEAAKTIKIPGLVMAGGQDCICPVENNQQPIYKNLISGFKAFVMITNGDHCGFSDSTDCWIGEAAKCGITGQGQTISDSLQMKITLKYVVMWLDSILKGDENAWISFHETLNKDKQVNFVIDGADNWPPASLPAPAISMKTDNTTVTFYWSADSGASSYIFFYAPYPYTGADSIRSFDLGNQTDVFFSLWPGAAFYVGVKAQNKNVSSDLSNILLVKIF